MRSLEDRVWRLNFGRSTWVQNWNWDWVQKIVPHDRSCVKPRSTSPTSKRHVLTSKCGTSVASLWRCSAEGDNACGLYYKLHGSERLLTIKNDAIQTRKRRPKNQPKTPTRSAAAASSCSGFSAASATSYAIINSPMSDGGWPWRKYRWYQRC